MTAEYRLCDVQELPAEGRGFSVRTAAGEVELLVLPWHGRVLAYRNRCPHTGVNLNWLPDRFLDAQGEYIQCATHGALFRPQDGYCVWGPCAGQGLVPVPLCVRDAVVYAEL